VEEHQPQVAWEVVVDWMVEHSALLVEVSALVEEDELHLLDQPA
jgi:hypothetical protein